MKNRIIEEKRYLVTTLPWAASDLIICKCQERGAHSQVQLPLKVSFKPSLANSLHSNNADDQTEISCLI